MQRHGINVPTSFYARFTKDVVKLAKIHTEGKVVSFLEGGYSDAALISGVFSHLIGLTNNPEQVSDDPVLWNATWGNDHVVKELTKGCKRGWIPYKNPRTEVTIWANEVIKLGRLLMPNSILPANYMYTQATDNSDDGLPVEYYSRMLRDIYDEKPSVDICYNKDVKGGRNLRNNRHQAKR